MSGETTTQLEVVARILSEPYLRFFPIESLPYFFGSRVIEKCAGTKKRPGARPAVHKDCYKLDQGVG
jgi:hypothetical protein